MIATDRKMWIIGHILLLARKRKSRVVAQRPRWKFSMTPSVVGQFLETLELRYSPEEATKEPLALLRQSLHLYHV